MKGFAFSKIRFIGALLVFFLTAGVFVGCSSKESVEGSTVDSNLLQAPELPLKKWTEEYLFEDIPAPKNTQVYELSNGTAYGWDYYGYKFENFTLEQAREYISLLESAGVSVEVYDEYYKNDYPILNYLGYTEDGVQVTVTQCHNSGSCGINIRSEKQ